MISEIFCCGECHSQVEMLELWGGDWVYSCVSPACGKTVSLDCPESLALVEDVTLKLQAVEVAAQLVGESNVSN